MRKSDKLKNFKKINLIVENRYLESKGIITESFHEADGTPIGVDSNHMPIQENNEEEVKNLSREINNTLRELLYGINPMGYLNGEHVLQSNISPRQMNRRVDNVVKVLSDYITYLNTTAKRSHNYGSDEYKKVWGDKEEGDMGLDEEYVSEAVGTDLEYITFSVDGEAYRPSKVINKEQVSNGLTIEFGLEKYDGSNWVPTGGMLTYYFDMDTRTDKLLFTNGRFENTIDAKKMIDTKYGLYEKIKQYVETRI